MPLGPLRSTRDTIFAARHPTLSAEPVVGESFAIIAVNDTAATTQMPNGLNIFYGFKASILGEYRYCGMGYPLILKR